MAQASGRSAARSGVGGLSALVLGAMLLAPEVSGFLGVRSGMGICSGLTRALSCRAGAMTMMATGNDKLAILISGLPGAMGKEISAACLRRGLTLCPWALTGPDVPDTEVEVNDGQGGKNVTLKLVRGPRTGDGAEECDARIQGLMAGYTEMGTRVIAIDFTHPSAVNNNARLFARHGIDFVMGTTGGDREALLRDVEAADIQAVIAPNMAKQIVAVQAALESMAKEFPGCFDGYQLKVEESHQSGKADTSGTAKALVAHMGELIGKPQDIKDAIKMIRDPPAQLEFGVPESALKGHAFHTYTLTSGDGSVQFQLQHNVQGRRVYAEGTVDAVVFLAQQPKSGKKIFTMIDVLRAGAM